MAHKKAAGGKIRQGNNVAGKRLGLKVSSGEMVKVGTILVRQKGNVSYPGLNVGQGRDFTLFSTANGTVKFRNMTDKKRGKKIIDVLENSN